MGALWDVFFLAIIAIACATVFVLVPPKGHRYLEHEKIHNMLIFGSAYRTMVSESLINTVNLRGTKGLVIEPSEYLGAGIVGTDGQIVLISQRPAAFVVMQPHMKDGQLTWTCGGKPEQLMPPACRDSLTFSVPSSDPVAPKVFDKGGRR